MTQPIGIVGVGLLGQAIAERLIAAGFDVIGHDLQTDLPHFVAAGGIVGESLDHVLGDCRRILLCLPDSDVVSEVASRLMPHASGKTFIDTTTGSPTFAVSIHKRFAHAGAQYLDATVAGSSRQMREHDATLLIGGDRQAYGANEDVFKVLGRESFFLGPAGSGARMKLVVNLAIGLHRVVLAEALALGADLGFDSEQVLTVLKATPAHSDAMDTKGQKMVDRDFRPQARLKQHLKDVQLMLKTAKGALPLTETHVALLEKLVEDGFGDEDNSAIVRAFLSPFRQS